MIRCGMLTVVLLFLFGLIWGGTFLWNRLTTDGEEQTFAGASVIEQPETFPKGKPRIMIDAGHGGKDQGTSAGNVLEKDLNLQVAEKLAKELKKRGASVLLTRTDDTKIPLEERAAMANEKEADLFVSIHCNYCEDDSSVQGLECYYREGSDEAQKLVADAYLLPGRSDVQCENRTNLSDIPQITTDWDKMMEVASDTAAKLNSLCK